MDCYWEGRWFETGSITQNKLHTLSNNISRILIEELQIPTQIPFSHLQCSGFFRNENVFHILWVISIQYADTLYLDVIASLVTLWYRYVCLRSKHNQIRLTQMGKRAVLSDGGFVCAHKEEYLDASQKNIDICLPLKGYIFIGDELSKRIKQFCLTLHSVWKPVFTVVSEGF